MNVLLLEDDLLQRNQLVKIIKAINSSFNIKTADTIKEALRISSECQIALFYIDIELSDGSGMNFSKKTREKKEYEFTSIVFISSYHHFALEAFKTIHCYDFLYKPYNEKEIKKVTQNLLASPYVKNQKRDFLVIKQAGIKMKIYLDDIMFVESIGKDNMIHTIHGIYNMKRTTLKEILSMIKSKENFIQSHRSYFINTNYVMKVQNNKGLMEIHFEKYDKTALIGCTYKERVNLLF